MLYIKFQGPTGSAGPSGFPGGAGAKVSHPKEFKSTYDIIIAFLIDLYIYNH